MEQAEKKQTILQNAKELWSTPKGKPLITALLALGFVSGLFLDSFQKNYAQDDQKTKTILACMYNVECQSKIIDLDFKADPDKVFSIAKGTLGDDKGVIDFDKIQFKKN